MNPAPELNNWLVISYLTLRKAIGILGVLLPFVVSLGAFLIFQEGIQRSLSSYYYTGVRGLFVGPLWAIGFFLLSYKGYERRDALAGDWACVFAVGVALFPTAPDGEVSQVQQIVSYAHGTFAALLFLTLSYFSIVLFTKTDPTKAPTPQKLKRNKVYYICGYTMLISVILVPLLKFFPGMVTAIKDPVFWLETIAIVAFGISWLTKGEAILSD